MSLLNDVIDYLEHRGVRSALIGGLALAAHGIARATLDSDLLVVNRAVLDATFWSDWTDPLPPEVRVGDADDPLAGVVRLRRAQDSVDVVVGKHRWEARIVERRTQLTVEGRALYVVDAPDLILLKLSAGGPQDLIDVRLLLVAAGEELRRAVEERLVELSVSVQKTWKHVLDASPTSP